MGALLTFSYVGSEKTWPNKTLTITMGISTTSLRKHRIGPCHAQEPDNKSKLTEYDSNFNPISGH